MDDELAAWCRDRLQAEPEAVLFRAGSLSTVTAPSWSGSPPTRRPSPPWAAWDHDRPGPVWRAGGA